MVALNLELGTQQRIQHMKTTLVSAATPAILAIAAIVLSFRYMSASALFAGYFCVAGIAAIAAVEYRLNWKRFFGR
jgi:O-antigen/teichoic acid export membrane protein